MNKPRCLCTHAKSRHRQRYGEPNTGSCRDCVCEVFEPDEGSPATPAEPHHCINCDDEYVAPQPHSSTPFGAVTFVNGEIATPPKYDAPQAVAREEAHRKLDEWIDGGARWDDSLKTQVYCEAAMAAKAERAARAEGVRHEP